MAESLQERYRISQRRACDVIPLHRSTCRYVCIREPQTALRQRIKELAEARVCYGYRRLHVLLQREGWKVNHKRVYRLYLLENLQIRRKKPRRHVAVKVRLDRPQAQAANECWSMDFMSDALFNGRKIRALTLVDNFSRESLDIKAGHSFSAERVVRVLDKVVALRGYPKTIRVDNGPEFTSKELDKWAYLNGVELDFSRPGKPVDNAYIEAFNSLVRAECLNQHWFFSVEEAQKKLDAWRIEYNTLRPHGSLGYLTPVEFAEKHQLALAG